MSRFRTFNFYFCFLALFFLCACKTTEERKRGKEASTLRLHLEVNQDGTQWNLGVPIYRERPVMVNVHREPFLTEGDVEMAEVVDAPGGYMLKVQFSRHGTLVLDTVTTSYKGRHIAVQSQFGESRWLAAPRINQRIANGLFVFTPDASREEAERIVRGLNHIAAELRKRY